MIVSEDLNGRVERMLEVGIWWLVYINVENVNDNGKKLLVICIDKSMHTYACT